MRSFMSRRGLAFGALGVLFGVLFLSAACTGAEGSQGVQGEQGPAGPAGSTALTDVPDLVQATRALAATAPFLDEAKALEAGYVGGGSCVSSPAGAMGIHYGNAALSSDGVIDAAWPETLLYIPTDTGVKLVGLEYVFPIGEPGAPIPDSPPPAPAIFGETFEGPMEGHGPSGPPHYDLHVWLWADNPEGIFVGMNPALTCPE